jgi:two-component system, sensor histidine kinase
VTTDGNADGARASDARAGVSRWFEVGGADARAARAAPGVAEVLSRSALAGDRGAVAITIVGSIVVAAVATHVSVRTAWAWCGACCVLAAVRLLFNAPTWRAGSAEVTPHARRTWLALLLAGSLVWGAQALIFVRDDVADTALLTGVFLAAAGMSAPLLSASRAAVDILLLSSLGPLLLLFAIRAALVSRAASDFVLAGVTGIFLLVLERLSVAQGDRYALLLAARFRNEELAHQLRSQGDLAARAIEEKTRFVASAAHDLRQPLHALGMFCATLEQRLSNTPEKPLMRNMMNAIESLETSFSAMLDISRLDAALVETAPQAFPIRDVFRRLYQHFGGDAEARGLALRFRATRRIVRSDPLLLERVLGNLVQNALRYTKRGGVLVAARRHARGVALEVWDTGFGIAENKREMIFREFYQIDNPERDRGRGLGLGLAIVQRLCRLLQHPLEVKSTLGRGSVFRLIVPAGDVSAVQVPAPEADTVPPRRTGVITVLLIDDERAIREATRQLLLPLNVEVIMAATIAEAVALARGAGGRVDMILSDWRLRGQENGVEAVRAVRAVTGEATPAVLITGDTSTELLRRAHESGLVVLHKPMQPRQLIRLIKHLRR